MKASPGRGSIDTETGEITPGEGWRAFPIAEFVDLGLLHTVNAEWFWDRGLALTARKWKPIDEIAVEWKPRIRQMLERMTSYPVTDVEVDQWFSGLTAGLGDKIIDGMYLTEADPVDTIVTALTPEQAADKRRTAAEWTVARKRQMDDAHR